MEISSLLLLLASSFKSSIRYKDFQLFFVQISKKNIFVSQYHLYFIVVRSKIGNTLSLRLDSKTQQILNLVFTVFENSYHYFFF